MPFAEHLEGELLDQAVLTWRQYCLRKAGVDRSIAAEIATHTEVDLHEAVALAENGCPDELLLQILL